MSETFDPYYKWLGIPPKDQPPNHYRLLGVELFESDLDVISIAADQRMGSVRQFQSGKYSKLSQRILNELSSARVCLLKPESKAKYDAQLRHFIEAEAAGAEPSALGQDALGVSVTPRGKRLLRKRQKTSRSGPIAVIATGVLLALGAIAWLVSTSNSSAPTPQTERQTRAAPPVPEKPPPSPQPAGAETRTTSPPAPLGSKQFQDAIAAVRAALLARKTADARSMLARAKSLAGDAPSREQVARLDALCGWVEKFWLAARKEIVTLGPGTEFLDGKRRIRLVEADNSQVVLRADGRDYRFPFERLPPQIALPVVKSQLDGVGPTTYLCLGAFLASDRWGSRGEARRLWRLAGAPAAGLLVELDGFPPAEPATIEQLGEPVLATPADSPPR